MQAFIHREFTGIHNGTTKKKKVRSHRLHQCSNAATQPFLHAEIQAFSTKNKRGFAPLLASMQQCSHSFTQKSKEQNQIAFDQRKV